MAHQSEGQVVALAFVKQHIRKYMAVKLDPARAPHTPNGHVVPRLLAQMVEIRLEHAIAACDLDRNIQHLPLRVVVPELPGLDPLTNRKLNEFSEELYGKEFTQTVDALHYNVPHLSKQDAINYFRGIYNITEADLQMESSIRAYRRYEENEGRPLARGGARVKEGKKVTTGKQVGKRKRARDRARRLAEDQGQ